MEADKKNTPVCAGEHGESRAGEDQKPANSFTAFEAEKQHPVAIKIIGGGFLVIPAGLLHESCVDVCALVGGSFEFRLQLPEQSLIVSQDEAKRIAGLVGGAI